jgi:hypothetical protein
VLNIALDPLFIYGLRMGVSGAAAATAISQLFSCACCWPAPAGPAACGSRSGTSTPQRARALILRGGPLPVPAGLRERRRHCPHHAAQPWGDAAIAAMGIVNRVTLFMRSP